MNGRFVLSPRAQTDLDDIWDYTADRWGLDQAETSTRDIWQRIEEVAARPAIGQECSDIHGLLQNFLRLAFPALPPHRRRHRYRPNPA
jgi:plasmid stabilization system protein ParE